MMTACTEAFETFLGASEVETTTTAFLQLLSVVRCESLYGGGLELFDVLNRNIAPKLNFRNGKIFKSLRKRMDKAKEIHLNTGGDRVKFSEKSEPFRVLVCGAGPVGLRSAVEAAMLGFRVTVVEKRRTFSRANIITFWSETMADMLELGAKTYLPNLCASGPVKHIGTKEIQLILLKNFLLLGGDIRYGMKIEGILPPTSSNKSWQGRIFSHQRDVGSSKYEHEQDAAEKATEFQKQKAYEKEWEKTGNKSKLIEKCDVDATFLSQSPLKEQEERIGFDAYLIGEGGWSYSTRKLGFDKVVLKREPVIGLVMNLEYDKSNPTERNLQSETFHCLSGKWPLKKCVVIAEFLEYLKGETHFFASVVGLENPNREKTMKYLAEARKTGVLTPETMKQMEFSMSRKGLLEMGVLRRKLNRSELLQKENVDAEALMHMARTIANECGLPPTTPFCKTNPVQIFDFSSLARCKLPMKILCNNGTIVDGTVEEAKLVEKAGTALLFPIGDALQEPLWTSGLGVNRGFHGGLNAVHAMLCARNRGIQAASKSINESYRKLIGMKWPNGLAGEGSKGCGVTNGDKWTCDPKSRLG